MTTPHDPLRSTFALPTPDDPALAGTVYLYRARLEAELAREAARPAVDVDHDPAATCLVVPLAAPSRPPSVWTAVALVLTVTLLASAVVLAVVL